MFEVILTLTATVVVNENAQTPDLVPRIEEMYHEIFGPLQSGSTLSTIFQIKRL
jgi:hypothetical protein